MDAQHVLVLLNQAQAYDATEAGFIRDTIAFVEMTPEFWSARSLDGHVTASAWIVTEDGTQTLLLHSEKYDLWLQPGGHPEDEDADILAASAREGNEETGLQ